jgi:branched-chain amino acid transport system substrate-binding protein
MGFFGGYSRWLLVAAFFFVSLLGGSGSSRAAEPIKFGLGAQLTGGLAGNGKAIILAMQIWAEDVNAKGGLLGRPVQLVYYDDQSNPGLVPGIYTKLLTVDKVDFLLGMSTNLIAPALPIVIRKKKLIMAMFAIGLNRQFNYPLYFQIQPFGPNGPDAMTHGFFDVAMHLEPKPRTIAMIGADAEFAKTILEGARASANAQGLKIVYDQVYPPNTVDLTPILRAVQATKPDLVLVASYPPDSVGVIRSAKEIGLETRLFGGSLTGLQYAAVKKQLGENLNGVLGFEIYTPEPSMQFEGIGEFLKKYQARAAADGSDSLGYYGPPYAYAAMQVLGQAITKAGSIDQDAVAKEIHVSTFKTVVGDIKFGPDGEWAKPRIITVQYQNLKGNELAQFQEPGHAVVLYPPEFKSGNVQTPYSPR